jgi:hypothetical protein
MKNLFTRFFSFFQKQSAPIEKTTSPSEPDLLTILSNPKLRREYLRKKQERIERNNAEYEEQQRKNEELKACPPCNCGVIGGIRFCN